MRFCRSDAPFIKDSIFHNFWPKFWPRFLRYFLNFRKCAYELLLQHRNILRKSEIRFCEVLRIWWTFSSNIQFFIIIDISWAQILRYFLNFRNALLNHFFSIGISCEKAKYDCVRFCIRCTFSSNIQFFIIFGQISAQILRYFLNFRKCAYESLLQHRNT